MILKSLFYNTAVFIVPDFESLLHYVNAYIVYKVLLTFCVLFNVFVTVTVVVLSPTSWFVMLGKSMNYINCRCFYVNKPPPGILNIRNLPPGHVALKASKMILGAFCLTLVIMKTDLGVFQMTFD